MKGIFQWSDDGQPVKPLVVRTARCSGIAVDGQEAKPGEVVQIGAVTVPPDGTGDINNYTIWHSEHGDCRSDHQHWLHNQKVTRNRKALY